MAILFVLRDGITSVVTIRQPRAAIIEIIILDTHVFERLSTQVHPRMASSAFILLKQFVACDLLGSQSRLVTHQILVEAARREQRLFKLGDSIGNRRLVETFRIHFEETFAQLLVFRQLGRYLVKRVAAHFNRVQRRPGSLFLQVGSTSVPKLQDIQSRVIHSRSIHAAELSVYPLGILFAVYTGSRQPVAGSTRDRVIAGKTGVMIKIEPQRYLGRIGRDGNHQRLHRLIGKFFGDGRCRIVLLTDILRPGKQDRLFVAIEVCPPVHRHVRILGGRHGT